MARPGIKALLAFAVAAATNASLAQGPDGSFYLEACGAAIRQADGKQISDNEVVGATFCASYIAGFLDATSLGRAQTGCASNRAICLPDRGITNDQVARLLVKFLREHPEQLHESGRMSLYIALAKVFPCS